MTAALGAGGLATASATARRSTPSEPTQAPPHLRGTAPLPFTQLISLDLAADDKQLGSSLRAAHRVVGALNRGKTATWLGLGSSVIPASADRPRSLKQMAAFLGDVLDPAQSHGALLLQITGVAPDAVRKAAEQALDGLPQWQIRWRLDGFRPGNRTENGRGLARNPFHFTEGYGNPATAAAVTERAAVAAGQGEPAWAIGGSYQVVRIIRLATDFWDRDTVREQERIIGRRRDGRWLDGTPSTEQPAFTADPHGTITPLDAHVRRAAPDRRHPPPLVRRGYNYHHGPDDQGLIFSCFQRDLKKGFEAVQHRLQGEAMAKYALTVGGGYFFVPPPGDSWLDALT
ncbi:Dyp-type peroxidase [Streptomyces sp. SID13726]|nr:Dyp-type peroxidase [Streptomyces sp. SID13726]